eukprot:jgi/Psemu1/57079/gm1.57079_g
MKVEELDLLSSVDLQLLAAIKLIIADRNDTHDTRKSMESTTVIANNHQASLKNTALSKQGRPTTSEVQQCDPTFQVLSSHTYLALARILWNQDNYTTSSICETTSLLGFNSLLLSLSTSPEDADTTADLKSRQSIVRILGNCVQLKRRNPRSDVSFVDSNNNLLVLVVPPIPGNSAAGSDDLPEAPALLVVEELFLPWFPELSIP